MESRAAKMDIDDLLKSVPHFRANHSFTDYHLTDPRSLL
jgi:hypothetical protein